MAEMKNRLTHYTALAAAIPAAAAHAGITAYNGPEIVILPGDSALIDFGAGYGEVFRFELRTTSTADRVNGFYNALFQFNPDNEAVQSAGFIGELHTSQTASGGTSSWISNDPQRLGFGAPVSLSQPFYEPMSDSFSTAHDLAHQSPSFPGRTIGYGSWYPDARGFIGFKMFKDGSFHFGWFDVETIGWGAPDRAVGPTLIIHGWAFQDEPRLPINTGDVPAPAAGGLLALALGAAGVRRSRCQAA